MQAHACILSILELRNNFLLISGLDKQNKRVENTKLKL